MDIQQDPLKSIEQHLAEPSLAHVVENLLNNKYDWAPKNVVFDEDNMPASKVQTNEEELKHVLSQIKPEQRQQNDYLHNLVHQPDTDAYMDRYHATDHEKMATDASGTTELFNDWALPYHPGLDAVMFNNHIHTQMNFGVADEV